MGQIISINLELHKIPKERIYLGKNGAKYISISVSERQAPDNYGHTHSVYLYDKNAPEGKKKTYVGNGKVFDFDNMSNAQEMQDLESLPTMKEKDFDDLPF